MNYCIGCDLGTSALKLTLADEKGNVIKSIDETYPLYFPKPGYSEQNPQDWVKALLKGINEITSSIDGFVTSIAIDGQMHGLVCLDENYDVIRNVILWNDSRSKKEVDYLNTIISKETLLEETGNIAYSGFTLPKILWLKENEDESFKKIKHIMLPKDYLNFVLTGKIYTDPSDAAGTLVYDVKNHTWSKKMIEISSLNASCFPEVINSGTYIGNVKEEIKKELDLTCDIHVYQGAGDNAAAAISNGTLLDCETNISLGTSGTIFINTKNYTHAKNGAIHTFMGANDQYCLLACMLSCASCLKWLNEDIFKTDNFTKEQEELSKNDIINNSLFFLPYMMGERSPINDDNIRGVFLGLNLNTKRKDMTLAVLEGVSFALKDSFMAIEEMGIHIQESKIIGGGSKSMLWLEILSSILNIPLHINENNYGPSYGMCMLCLVGEKHFSSLAEIKEKCIHVKKTIYPNKELIEHYKEKYNRFKKIYPTIKDLF